MKPMRSGIAITMLLLLISSAWAVEAPIVISGSTTFQKRILEPMKAELEKKTKRQVEIRGGGTISGLRELIKGEASAAMISAPLDVAFLETGVPEEGTYQEHIIAKDVLVPIVHPTNPVRSLTLEQLADILSGKISNWKNVGGPDRPIVVMVPPKSSGTRKFLQESIMNGSDFAAGAYAAVTTREEIDLVVQAPIGLGVLSEGFVKMNKGKVKVIKCKPVARQLSIVTKGVPSKEVMAVITILRSAGAKKYFK